MLHRILNGKECLCTHAGSSQYSRVGSASACGLAAMNCARHLLSLERQGISGDELLETIMLKETMEEIMSICANWTSDAHLEVDDIYKTPLFEASLKLVRTDYGQAGKPKFERMLRHLEQLTGSPSQRSSCAVVITRPPEIVTCLRVAHPLQDLFVVFDSHPRSAHPAGAAFFFCRSRESAAQYLANLFPVDSRLLAPESGLQWQAELLAHVSGHFFECSRSDMRMSRDAEHAFIEANCAILLTRAQESEAQSHRALLASENERLKKDLELMEGQIELFKHERASHAFEQNELRELRESVLRRTSALNASAWQSLLCTSETDFEDQSSDEHIIVRTPHRVGSSSDPFSSSATTVFCDKISHLTQPSVSSTSLSSTRMKGKGRASYNDDEDDLDIAIRMQMEYQSEDIALAAQMQLLQASFVQQIFDCSICMDQLPIDDVARIDGCEHAFCRNCIRQYISSKLEERKFPMPCPCCTAEKDGGGRGNVTEALIHQIGISEKSYTIFNELQITKFSIPIQCKRCNRSAFVDKHEFERAKVLFCPFPNCSYSWCKDCQQEVSASTDGPIHSCDGSEEFNHLMSQRGWKHCPGCKTPTEKTEGCNHMTCGSPGCNTHFCYICGVLIVRSAQRSEIDAHVKTHYRANCPLFHVPQEN